MIKRFYKLERVQTIDKKKKLIWNWHLLSPNGSLVAQGCGYAKKVNLERAIDVLVTRAFRADNISGIHE